MIDAWAVSILANLIIYPPVEDDNHKIIIQHSNEVFADKNAKIVLRRPGRAHDSERFDHTVVISSNAKVVIEQPGRRGHSQETRRTDDRTGEHTAFCHSASPLLRRLCALLVELLCQ